MPYAARSVASLILCTVPGCRSGTSGVQGPLDLMAVDEHVVTSVEYRVPGRAVIARRTSDGTFAVQETASGGREEKCRPGEAFVRGIRPLFHIRGLRRLSGAENARLQRTTEDGVLRIQDVIAHEGGDLAPPEWTIYPHFGTQAPVVAVDIREKDEAWEVDIPKETLKLLRAGCGSRGSP